MDSSSTSADRMIVYLRTIEPSPTRQMCRVCSRHQESSGWSYGTKSCNACKMAFRRFIDSGCGDQCGLQNNCTEIQDVVDAYRCHACRFAKCLLIGMKPDQVRSDEPQTVARNLWNVKRFLEARGRTIFARPKRPCTSDEAAPPQVELKRPKIEEEQEEEQVQEVALSAHKVNNVPNGPVVIVQETFTTVSRNIVNEPTLRAHISAIIAFAKSVGFFAKITSNVRIRVLSHFAMILIIMNNDYSPLFNNEGMVHGIGGGGREGHPQYLLAFPMLLQSSLDTFEHFILHSICLCHPALDSITLRDRKTLTNERKSHVKSLHDYCTWNSPGAHGVNRFREIMKLANALENNLRAYYTDHMERMIPVNEIMIEYYKMILLA